MLNNRMQESRYQKAILIPKGDLGHLDTTKRHLDTKKDASIFDRLVTKEYSGRLNLVMISLTMVISWTMALRDIGVSRIGTLAKSGESNRPILSIGIAVHVPFLSRYFCKSMPSSWQKVAYSHLHRDTFAEVLGSGVASGKKMAHKHNFVVRLPLGRPRDCPWDKPGLSLGQTQFVPGTTQVFSLFYQVEAQFVPGTNPIGPRNRPSLSLGQSRGRRAGRTSLCVKRLSREKLYTTPPPSPHFWPKGIFQRRGWGCIFRGPTRQEFYTPPFLYTPHP